MNWIFSTTLLFYGGQKTNGSAPKHASLPNLSCRGGCADEQEAIGKAAQAANGKAVELWEGARLIVRFPQHEG